MEFCHCSYFDIRDGKISAKVEDTPIGSISLKGKFLPAKRGDYWLVSSSTPVLKAQINVIVKGEVVFSSEDHEFAFVIGK
jgi:hypothetical protein